MNLIKCPTCDLYTKMTDESGQRLDGYAILLRCVECKTLLCVEIPTERFRVLADETVPARRAPKSELSG